jgi:sulfatase modifying factor 1
MNISRLMLATSVVISGCYYDSHEHHQAVMPHEVKVNPISNNGVAPQDSHPDVTEVTEPVVGEIRNSCPADMLLVEGMYCPVVEEICLYDVDANGNRLPGPHNKVFGRCGKFQFPTRCLSKTKEYKKFCIDRFEIPNIEGAIPQSWMSWYDVKNFCESHDKKMLTASQWVFACEGESMKPYPYKSGYIRDTTACNFDNPIPKFSRFKDSKEIRYMDRLLVPASFNSECRSDFGAYNMVGNIDEFVVNETKYPYHSALVGGHAVGVRNRCRTSPDQPGVEGTTAHNEYFSFWETGGRCGKDILP